MNGYPVYQRFANLLCVVILFISLPLAEVRADSPSQNPTFTVNTSQDTLDAHPGDGKCADKIGFCSLRAAIQEANADPGQVYLVILPAGNFALTIAGAGEDDNTLATSMSTHA